MTSEFGFRRNVIVTPEMLKNYFSMTKTEILAHLFLLSVCDSDRHIKRNVRALGRETERWHAGIYRAIMGLKLKKMLEEKMLKTKGGRYWRVYPLPKTRVDKSKPALEPFASLPSLRSRTSFLGKLREGKEKAKQNSQPRNGVGTELIESVAINQQTMPEKTELKWKKGFLRRALKRIRHALERSEGRGKS